MEQRLRDSGPWLAPYVERMLREPSADLTLGGHYLQVVTPVRDRHLHVTDGKHSMEAILTTAAAASIDADEDDIGISVSTLCGHLIALMDILVIPDISFSAPHATLLLRKISVFPDRKLLPPAGVHPCVLTHSKVADAIRVSIGRSIAQLPSTTTTFDPLPEDFPPSGLEEQAVAFAGTLASQTNVGGRPRLTQAVNADPNEHQLALDAVSDMDANVCEPNDLATQLPTQVQVLSQEQTQPHQTEQQKKKSENPVASNFMQWLSSDCEECSPHHGDSDNNSDRRESPSNADGRNCIDREELIEIVELPQTQYVQFDSDEDEDDMREHCNANSLEKKNEGSDKTRKRERIENGKQGGRGDPAEHDLRDEQDGDDVQSEQDERGEIDCPRFSGRASRGGRLEQKRVEMKSSDRTPRSPAPSKSVIRHGETRSNANSNSPSSTGTLTGDVKGVDANNGDDATDAYAASGARANECSGSSTTASPPGRKDGTGNLTNQQLAYDGTGDPEARESKDTVREIVRTQPRDECEDDVDQTEVAFVMPLTQCLLDEDEGEVGEENEKSIDGDSNNDASISLPSSQPTHRVGTGEKQLKGFRTPTKVAVAKSKRSSRGNTEHDTKNPIDSSNDSVEIGVVADYKGRTKKRRRMMSVSSGDSFTTKVAEMRAVKPVCAERPGNKVRTCPHATSCRNAEPEGHEQAAEGQPHRQETGRSNDENFDEGLPGLTQKVQAIVEKINLERLPIKVIRTDVVNVESNLSTRHGVEAGKRRRLAVTDTEQSDQSGSRKKSKSPETKYEANLCGQNTKTIDKVSKNRLRYLMQHMVSPLNVPLHRLSHSTAANAHDSSDEPRSAEKSTGKYAATRHSMTDQGHGGVANNSVQEKARSPAEQEDMVLINEKPTQVDGQVEEQVEVQAQTHGEGLEKQSPPPPAPSVSRRGRRGRPPGRGIRGGAITRTTRSRDKKPDTDQSTVIPVTIIDTDSADPAAESRAVENRDFVNTRKEDKAIVATTDKVMAVAVEEAVEKAVEKVLEKAPTDRVVSIDVDIDMDAAPQEETSVVEPVKKGRESANAKASLKADPVSGIEKPKVIQLADSGAKGVADVEMVDILRSDTERTVAMADEERDAGDATTEDDERSIAIATAKVDAALDEIRRIRRAKDQNPIAFVLMPEIFMNPQKDSIHPTSETHNGNDVDLDVRRRAAARIPDSAPI